MDFIEFQDSITKELECRYPNDKVRVETVTKNNNLKLTGVSVIKEGTKCSPVVYLESFYNKQITKEDIHKVVAEIEEIFNEHSNVEFDDLVNNIRDFNFVKDRIFFQVINTKKNKHMLNQCPNRSFLDISVIYKINVFDESAGEGTITIKNDIMKMWGVTEEDLWNCAVKNTPQMFPAKNDNIFNLLYGYVKNKDDEAAKEFMELWEKDKDIDSILVVTNKQQLMGASTILYEGILKEIYNKVGRNYYIALSSVHEFLVFHGKNLEKSPYELKDIVKCVNSEQVSAEEVLSDEVYYYDGELDKLSIL